MKEVAKLILRDQNGLYLLLYRNDHPAFGQDPDLPGGTIEEGEDPIKALIREVKEEIGITLNSKSIKKLHESNEYDKGNIYYLYEAMHKETPVITISWEHSRYSWLSLSDFAAITNTAIDRYMHMVHDYLAQKQ